MADLRLIVLVALVALALMPAEALACPNCVLRENTPGRIFMLVGMMLLPWTVVGFTVFGLRRVLRKERDEEGT